MDKNRIIRVLKRELVSLEKELADVRRQKKCLDNLLKELE